MKSSWTSIYELNPHASTIWTSIYELNLHLRVEVSSMSEIMRKSASWTSIYELICQYEIILRRRRGVWRRADSSPLFHLRQALRHLPHPTINGWGSFNPFSINREDQREAGCECWPSPLMLSRRERLLAHHCCSCGILAHVLIFWGSLTGVGIYSTGMRIFVMLEWVSSACLSVSPSPVKPVFICHPWALETCSGLQQRSRGLVRSWVHYS